MKMWLFLLKFSLLNTVLFRFHGQPNPNLDWYSQVGRWLEMSGLLFPISSHTHHSPKGVIYECKGVGGYKGS